MTDKVIVFKNDDGTCGIVIPMAEMFNSESRTRKNLGLTFESDAEILDWIANKDVPAGKEWRITDKANIPNDRTFRSAWTDDNDSETVDVDMATAKVLHLNALRELRKSKFKQLDIEYQRADENSDPVRKSEIATIKQTLRDIPQTLDLSAVSNPAELKAIIPSELQ